ncbi:hypothetical protein LKMONMHP_2082 [Methylobacterium organophilum]|uniref:Uncharacterized protein n=1 Tax=Methylobacterium organophilum TaxID=410 RepID=A0ABQ4T6C0_METOR|nr:hypothetical protein LKMONMHP_2082 [Methylobacterium organophilum]
MRADGAFRGCPVPGCGRPPQARDGRGVSLVYCRHHCQAANRHGCHWKKTYSAADLKPYRAAARRFIRANPHDIWIVHALFALEETLRHAGPVHRVVDTYRMAPADKARAALARMRRWEVPPEKLLVNYLAVCCAIEEDPIRAGSETENYRRVQAAKACARMAASNREDYLPARHKRYARSTGLALVHLGRMLEAACEHVHGYHLPAILALAHEAATSRRDRDAATR